MNKHKPIDPKVEDSLYKVIGAAIEVHRTLGAGLLEGIYEAALCVELDERGIPYQQQAPIEVTYKGRNLGDMCLDILVDDCLILELKAVERLLPVHMAQTMTYLKLTGIRLGLLMNFNTKILKKGIKRVVL